MRRLHRRCLALKRQQKQLEREQQKAHYNLVLLRSLCQSLDIVNVRRGTPESGSGFIQGEFAQAATAEELEFELELEPGRLAPRNDPFALFKFLLTEAPEYEEQNVTAAGLANLLREAVLQVGRSRPKDWALLHAGKLVHVVPRWGLHHSALTHLLLVLHRRAACSCSLGRLA